MSAFSVFEYLYRDASNFKVWGSVLLQGKVTPADLQHLRQSFDAGEFFIAEQLGLPPLYTELWVLSDGPTSADHVWHTFHLLRLANTDEVSAPAFDTVENFIARIEAVRSWDGKQSPHWEL